MSTFTVDLNCDMGESFGTYHIGHDEEILNYVSSANIACGFHAGDPAVMKKTVRLALQKGVALGAHPGLPDLQGFGRREMMVTPEEAYDLVLYQLGALWAFAKSEGASLKHVKPHGALYNMAARQATLAEAIARAVYAVDPNLLLYGLAGSELIEAGKKQGLTTIQEVFADRSYQADGTLTPRSQPNALLTDPDMAVQQVVRMVREGQVSSLQGTSVALTANTVCIHGDGPYALQFARHIHTTLRQKGWECGGSRFGLQCAVWPLCRSGRCPGSRHCHPGVSGAGSKKMDGLDCPGHGAAHDPAHCVGSLYIIATCGRSPAKIYFPGPGRSNCHHYAGRWYGRRLYYLCRRTPAARCGHYRTGLPAAGKQKCGIRHHHCFYHSHFSVFSNPGGR
jgi:UPF0271 protein